VVVSTNIICWRRCDPARWDGVPVGDPVAVMVGHHPLHTGNPRGVSPLRGGVAHQLLINDHGRVLVWWRWVMATAVA
jgi:hypothetical protein